MVSLNGELWEDMLISIQNHCRHSVCLMNLQGQESLVFSKTSRPALWVRPASVSAFFPGLVKGQGRNVEHLRPSKNEWSGTPYAFMMCAGTKL